MKRLFILFGLLLVIQITFSQNVGVGTTTPHSSAALDVQSTTKGLLLPRMTTVQRDAINAPTPGLIIFNTDTQSLEVFTNTGWFTIKKTNFPIEKLLGGTGAERYPVIQKTTDGGYIIAGQSASSATGNVTGTNHGNYDYWIIKLNVSGNIVWNKLLGGNNDEKPYCINQTTDGGYIVAGISSSSANGDVTGTNHGPGDYWIVKLDANGNITWNKLLGGDGGELAGSIQQTTDGGYIIAGISTSSANGDVTATNHGVGSTYDFWIVKLDATGNIIWNKLLGGSGYDDVENILQTADGGYIAAGYSTSSANGDVTGTNQGGNDFWIIKLDAGGNITWNKLLGGNGNDVLYSIQQTTDGGYITTGFSSSSANGDVTGTNHGNWDYWVVKLDAAGNISWNKLLGANGDEIPFSIKQTADGGYIVAGTSSSSANGDVTGISHSPGASDYWIVKLNASGNILWNKLLGGSNFDDAPGIQLTADGGFIIVGHSSSSATGDVTGVTHGGGTDFWIVKIDGAGNIINQ